MKKLIGLASIVLSLACCNTNRTKELSNYEKDILYLKERNTVKIDRPLDMAILDATFSKSAEKIYSQSKSLRLDELYNNISKDGSNIEKVIQIYGLLKSKDLKFRMRHNYTDPERKGEYACYMTIDDSLKYKETDCVISSGIFHNLLSRMDIGSNIYSGAVYPWGPHSMISFDSGLKTEDELKEELNKHGIDIKKVGYHKKNGSYYIDLDSLSVTNKERGFKEALDYVHDYRKKDQENFKRCLKLFKKLKLD